ncbi:hypothetical protein BH10PSE18_BH10PSE18_20920 [soil metagenome]
MNTATACLLAFGLAYAGMAALCLAMDRHHAQVWRRDASPAFRRALQAAGWTLIALAAVPCVRSWGGSVGTVLWLGWLSAAALALVLLLSYRPRLAAAFAVLCGPLALGGLTALSMA